jgi:hypothetical protein
LRVAEEKVALVKRLIPQLHHAIDEYHSHSQPLGDHLGGGFEKSMASVEKMIMALESYLALRAPTAPVFETAVESGPTEAGSATTTTSAESTSTSANGAGSTGETKSEPAAQTPADAAAAVSGRTS